MKRMLFFLTCFHLFLLHNAVAQHGHTGTAPASVAPLSFAQVLDEKLTDPELKNYKMESSVMTIAPGASDTVAHRHDCELFGYILEGEVYAGLENQSPKLFSAVQMFFEKRNVLHSHTSNASTQHAAKVLLISIIREGREGYTVEYPKKQD